MISIVLAFTTLVGIFLFFRIEKVIEILVGDGKSVLDRQREAMDNKSKTEALIGEKFWKRLRDAIYRKNIYGIEEGIRRISITEKKTIENPGPNGYSKHVIHKFLKTKSILSRLKLLLVLIISNSLFIIFLEFLNKDRFAKIYCFSETFIEILKVIKILVIASFFILVIISIVYSLYSKTPHEKEKVKECQKLKI